MSLRARQRATAPRPQRALRFIVSAPRGASSPVEEPDFAALGATVVNRSTGSWLVQGPQSAQALEEALVASGRVGWSVYPERFYRMA